MPLEARMVLNFKPPAATSITEVRETDLVRLGDAHCDLLDRIERRMGRHTGDVLHLAVRSLAVKMRASTTAEVNKAKEEDQV